MCFDGENVPLGAFLKRFFFKMFWGLVLLVVFFFNPVVENPLSEDGAV